jgi:threonine synthase
MSLIERYRAYLPVPEGMPIVSLGEGNTPLIKLHNLQKSQKVSLKEWYVKTEGSNPTGSFKDRGMTLAVSHARHEGAAAVLCASTGNTSASAAAFAARAGMQAFVIVPSGKIAMGKLAQALIHGALVLQINGNFDAGMNLVKQLSKVLPMSLVNSVNPYRIQGQKTVAFEVVDTLKKAPDYHYIPVGNAANISAAWAGYEDYFNHQKINQKPKMVGYQASGAAPFLRGHPVLNPQTVATAICIGNPHSWDLAQNAVKSSEGWFGEVSDDEILEAQYLLASTEGIFCEPASAASVAGVLKDIRDKKMDRDATVVCTLTGHGLKDPGIAIEQGKNRQQLLSVENDYEEVKKVLERYLR